MASKQAARGVAGSSKCQDDTAVRQREKEEVAAANANFQKCGKLQEGFQMPTSRKTCKTSTKTARIASVHKNTETQDIRTHVDCVFKHLASKRDGTVNADAVVIHTAALGRSIKSHSPKNTVAHILYLYHFRSHANHAQFNILTSVIIEA